MTRAGWTVTGGFVVLAALVAALLVSLRGGPAAPMIAQAGAPAVRVAPLPAKPAPLPLAQAHHVAFARPLPAGASPAPPAPGSSAPHIDPRLDGARVREMVLEDLKQSGDGTEDWNGSAESVFAAIGKPPVSFSDDGCWVAGCAATFTYASQDAYEQALAALPAMPAYKGWSAGKRLTPPDLRPDGTVQMTIVLYRPD